MPRIDLVKKTQVSSSGRARQLEGMFDVPRKRESLVEWHGDLPIEGFAWNVGLIVGPSGSGKSSILEHVFGSPKQFRWGAASVIDDFDKGKSMVEISAACRAVGFNTIPSWLRPYAVLSNGERFRVELARRLVECAGAIVVDEFTSVVDRQVGQIASHAVQKYVRKAKRRFVAASCHYDIIEWLQPDWILEPAAMRFTRRSLQRRPALPIAVCRVPYAAWSLFAPFHYLTAELHRAARCYGLFVGERIAAFAAVLFRPVSHMMKTSPIYGVSRLVCLPDWQGLGLAPILTDTVGSAYRALGARLHTYPAHPSLIRTFHASKSWRMVQKPKMTGISHSKHEAIGRFGGRPCAVFEYVGAAMSDKQAAHKFIEARI
jgi:ABC-type uncharacterized transport system YnjBCD ATPase subunit